MVELMLSDKIIFIYILLSLFCIKTIVLLLGFVFEYYIINIKNIKKHLKCEKNTQLESNYKID